MWGIIREIFAHGVFTSKVECRSVLGSGAIRIMAIDKKNENEREELEKKNSCTRHGFGDHGGDGAPNGGLSRDRRDYCYLRHYINNG